MLDGARKAMWVIALLALCGVGRADDRSDAARRTYERGIAHFNLDEYNEAILLFEEAYRLKPHPTLLYNIAQAARLGKNPDKALAFYEKYLWTAKNPSNAEEVQQRITALQEEIERRKAGETAREPSVKPPTNEEPPALVGTRPADRSPRSGAVPSSSRHGAPRIAIGMVIAGSVIALAGGGLLVGGAVIEGDADGEPLLASRLAGYEQADRLKIAGAVALGAGIVAAATGAVWWSVRSARSARSAKVARGERGVGVRAGIGTFAIEGTF